MIEAWITASHLLGFEIVAPFTLRKNKQSAECVAFLPHFGGLNGAVIGVLLPPDSKINQHLAKLAKDSGMFYSFVSAETYSAYDELHFKETLIDWGFFGPQDRRPKWWIEGRLNS